MPNFKYEFGGKEGEVSRWWQWSFAFWGYPQSVEAYIFNLNFHFGLVVQWHPRWELDMRESKWQPVWVRMHIGFIWDTLTLEVWIPVWLLNRHKRIVVDNE